MKVIICGSRNVSEADAVFLVIDAIRESGWSNCIKEVIHGDARGIDSVADAVCRQKHKVTPVPAEWDKFGNSAGPIRNKKMADMADAVIAIWDGKSPGTSNMIQTACKAGLPVFIFPLNERKK